jgi:hypothetical protein
MSILKKIFGASAAEKEIRKAQKALKARPPRVVVTPLHRIFFRPTSDQSRNLNLGNVSVGGMAVIHENAKGFTKDGIIGGTLIIDTHEIAIEARIRHLTEAIAGCEFIDQNLSLKRSVEQYLRVEILALNLTQVSESYLKPDPRGKTLWLTDGRQNELFAIIDSEGVVAFHLSFVGTYVEGGRGQIPRVGNTQEKVSEMPGHKGSTLVGHVSAEVSRETIVLARVFIQNIDRAAQEVRDQLGALLKVD